MTRTVPTCVTVGSDMHSYESLVCCMFYSHEIKCAQKEPLPLARITVPLPDCDVLFIDGIAPTGMPADIMLFCALLPLLPPPTPPPPHDNVLLSIGARSMVWIHVLRSATDSILASPRSTVLVYCNRLVISRGWARPPARSVLYAHHRLTNLACVAGGTATMRRASTVFELLIVTRWRTIIATNATNNTINTIHVVERRIVCCLRASGQTSGDNTQRVVDF